MDRCWFWTLKGTFYGLDSIGLHKFSKDGLQYIFKALVVDFGELDETEMALSVYFSLRLYNLFNVAPHLLEGR